MALSTISFSRLALVQGIIFCCGEGFATAILPSELGQWIYRTAASFDYCGVFTEVRSDTLAAFVIGSFMTFRDCPFLLT